MKPVTTPRQDMPPKLRLDSCLSSGELIELAYAKYRLENQSFAARVTELLGTPIEAGFRLLPLGWAATINRIAQQSLLRALRVATGSMQTAPQPASRLKHKFLVAASGGVGGAFGLAGLPFELPVSTTLMLRSIADIARSEGADVSQPEIRLQCLEVFAFGTKREGLDPGQSTYWAVRLSLSQMIRDAALVMTQRELGKNIAAPVTKLVTKIGSRFGVLVSEEVAAKSVPIVGAISGAIINLLFIDHFQTSARGHFVVRRLERKHGTDAVRDAYRWVEARPPNE